MSADLPEEQPSAFLDEQPVRGHPLIAWVVILLVTGGLVWVQAQRPEPVEEEDRKHDRELTQEWEEKIAKLIVIGAESARNDPEQREQLLSLARNLDYGPVKLRLRYIVLRAEIEGPEKVLDPLRAFALKGIFGKEQIKEQRLVSLLAKLYAAYQQNQFQNVLTPEEEKELRAELGWYGELALAPREGDPGLREKVLEEARELTLALSAAVGGGCLGLVLGIVVFITLLVFLLGNPRRRAFTAGSPYHAVYAETFAIWLVVYAGVMIGAALLPRGESSLFLTAVLGLATTIVLFWPVMRGVPWAEVKLDVGLTAGKGLPREVFNGILCYLTVLPLALLGLFFFFLLVQAVGENAMPGMHPIFLDLPKMNDWQHFQLYFAACAQAPVVEELFFRGVLYRHLRDGTRRLAYAGSFFLSALINGLIFAAVHPQGLLAIPVLTCVSLAFTIGREWRDSLLPSMVAHGIHNAIILTVALSFLG